MSRWVGRASVCGTLIVFLASLPFLSGCAESSIPVPQAGTNLEGYSDEVRRQIEAVEGRLTTPVVVAGSAPRRSTLASRMNAYRVPGVSIAVIDGGEIAWARGYGSADLARSVYVDSRTRFQAASISKPVSAALALRLVEQGVLDLDRDVNETLTTWKVPQNQWTRSEKVTLRRLLSHTAGTTVHGFAGYLPGRPVPTLQQILDGHPPSNSAAVRVDLPPGQRFRYSGGGYTVVEQLIEDATGRGFVELVDEQVLSTLGMDRSTYAGIGDDPATNTSFGYTSEGRLVDGTYHVYPEHAAASLWTTPSDLARFAIEVMRAYRSEEGGLLAPSTVHEMLTPVDQNFGLGLVVVGDGRAKEFTHGGSNAGFKCEMVAFPEAGVGIVVMTNGDRGSDLTNEIIATVAEIYRWPSRGPRERAAVEPDEAILAEIVGRYDTDVGVGIELTRRDDRIWISVGGGEPDPLYFAPDGKLFLLTGDVELEVRREGDGRVEGVTVTTPRFTVQGTKR